MIKIKKYAAIDIGSNAMRLLVTNIIEENGKETQFSKSSLVRVPIRLGQDAALRTMIKSKLKIAKQNSPLWKAQQFTQAMEKAYQQMWQIYCESDLNLIP
jgi:exopolyphosphatase/pppGpp-phosphohydrolase